MRDMTNQLQIFIDFDGTISLTDTTDLLLERFAASDWEAVEAEWLAGRIGSRECMARQIALLRVSPAALNDFIASIGIDQAFAPFVDLCQKAGAEVAVLSDGLDHVVGEVLRGAGLSLPIFANRLEFKGDDRWALSFPYSKAGCASGAGTCKCAMIDWRGIPPRAMETVLIGDGRSDFCGAGRADHVFAKAKLVQHCRETNIPHTAFSNFSDLIPVMADWLERRRLDLPAAKADALHA